MSEQVEFSKLYPCVYELHYHLVIGIKYRRKCIDAPMLVLPAHGKLTETSLHILSDTLVQFREIAEARCSGW
jgi:REP element-mobilizing transposase RayT